MRSSLVRKLKALALICLCSSFAGVLFQLINEKRIDHNSILVGLPLGLAFGILEIFIFRGRSIFRQWPFTRVLVFKTVLYTAIIYVVSTGLAVIGGVVEGRSLSELPAYLVSIDELVLVVYSLVLYGIFLFTLQINQLLGEGVLWKFIRGKYHKPREEERIFMFLDMKSSTTIAERLGHVRFYNLLNELFHDISRPALQTEAEIYQYVGDEVVLTWNVERGLRNSNCLKLFFLFRDTLVRKSGDYLKDFGVMPEFKAGLHFGKVVSAQIGDLKREITYNGDVLNTTARIRDECTRHKRDCLVSGVLMNQLRTATRFQWEKIDTAILRGKEQEVELFSVGEAN